MTGTSTIECVNVDGCRESDCGAGVCRDLPSPACNNSTKHFACDCDPDHEEVVVGGTRRTCRNNAFGYEVLRVRVAKMSTSAFPGVITRHVSLALVTTTWRLLVRLSKRIHERGGEWQAELSNEMCGVAPIGIQERHWQNYRMDVQHAAVRRGSHSPGRRAGRTHRVDAIFDACGAFSAGHTCHPVKCALPSLANTNILMARSCTVRR